MKMDAAIAIAKEKMMKIWRDPKRPYSYEVYERSLREYEKVLQNVARKAKLEGEHDKAVAIARELKSMDMPFAQIAEDTGLSLNEIARLYAPPGAFLREQENEMSDSPSYNVKDGDSSEKAYMDGTDIHIYTVLECIDRGLTNQQIFEKYPELTEAHIREAELMMMKILRDPGLNRAWYMHMRSIREYEIGMRNAERRGYEEGRRNAARRMKGRNVPLARIAERTGLSLDEIAKL
jgi:hypothetical protein